MIFYEQQANVKYDPKLQLQVPKEELERIKMENILLERQMSADSLQTEEGKAALLKAINETFNMMAKARIAQYGYIPNNDPWRDLNESFTKARIDQYGYIPNPDPWRI